MPLAPGALGERVAEMLGQDAADHVGASSGRPRHDDAHGFARPNLWGRRRRRLRQVLCSRWRDGGTGERPDDRERSQKPMHVSPP
jgi:hypothetical protein